MRRALNALILLYPHAWRNRYKTEFNALLDDVPPTWHTLLDVFGGALKMQLKISSPWKTVAAFAVTGAVAAIAITMFIPKHYVSTAIINMGNTPESVLVDVLHMVESRQSLTNLIVEQRLYQTERAREPIEDIVERMKQRDIVVSKMVGQQAIAVSFASSDPAEAQRTAEQLAAKFVDAKIGTVIDPARVPVTADGPRLSKNITLGTLTGVILGSLFALFAGLKVWKLAASLGAAGALAGAAIGFMIPDRFSSQAVVRYTAPDEAAARARILQLVEAVTSDASLHAVVEKYNLYPNEGDREHRLRDRLHFNFLRNKGFGKSLAMVIGFDDRDRYTAQKVTANMVSRIMDEMVMGGVRSGITLELLDPPSLPLNPTMPNRPVVSFVGAFAGLACATLFGVWRRYKKPALTVA